ncbi:MAG: thiamine-phosphate kinase [Chloroflexota bacterium]
MTSAQTVADVGEFEVIARLKRCFGEAGVGIVRGIGDDTAALRISPGFLLLATTDAAVEGVHFQRASTTPRLLGRRVLAVNLSDVAAMGGVPRWALVSLSLPGQTPLDFVEELASGLGEEAARFGVGIVGGNLARSPERLVLDLTLLGEGEPDRVVYRTGARAGDRLLVTGALGDAAAGLAILLGDAPASAPGAEELIARQRLPTPRVEAGQAIARSGLATAMIDLSDGLASDLGHLGEANQLGAIVDAARVPLSTAIQSLASTVGRDPLDWALHGGEDYELLLAAPPGRVDDVITAVQAVGVPLTEVGELTSEPGVWLRRPDGRREPLSGTSWRHF